MLRSMLLQTIASRTLAALTVGLLLALAVKATAASTADGLIKIKSPYSVKETANKVAAIASRKGLKLFSRFDHQKSASGENMRLRPTEVIVFGNAKVGTPLMQCAQTAAIDMPQKMLIMEDIAGTVWVAYTDPDYLAQRHHIKDCKETLAKLSDTLSAIASAVVK